MCNSFWFLVTVCGVIEGLSCFLFCSAGKRTIWFDIIGVKSSGNDYCVHVWVGGAKGGVCTSKVIQFPGLTALFGCWSKNGERVRFACLPLLPHFCFFFIFFMLSHCVTTHHHQSPATCHLPPPLNLPTHQQPPSQPVSLNLFAWTFFVFGLAFALKMHAKVVWQKFPLWLRWETKVAKTEGGWVDGWMGAATPLHAPNEGQRQSSPIRKVDSYMRVSQDSPTDCNKNFAAKVLGSQRLLVARQSIISSNSIRFSRPCHTCRNKPEFPRAFSRRQKNIIKWLETWDIHTSNIRKVMSQNGLLYDKENHMRGKWENSKENAKCQQNVRQKCWHCWLKIQSTAHGLHGIVGLTNQVFLRISYFSFA